MALKVNDKSNSTSFQPLSPSHSSTSDEKIETYFQSHISDVSILDSPPSTLSQREMIDNTPIGMLSSDLLQLVILMTDHPWLMTYAHPRFQAVFEDDSTSSFLLQKCSKFIGVNQKYLNTFLKKKTNSSGFLTNSAIIHLLYRFQLKKAHLHNFSHPEKIGLLQLTEMLASKKTEVTIEDAKHIFKCTNETPNLKLLLLFCPEILQKLDEDQNITFLLWTMGRRNEAETWAMSVTDTYVQKKLLQGICGTLIEEKNMVEAERIANNIPDKFGKSEILEHFSKCLFKAGNLPEAERIANNIPFDLVKSTTLAAIGKVEEAERIANMISNQFEQSHQHKSNALRILSETLFNSGNIVEAERVARTIPRLTMTCKLLYKMGKIDEAEQLANLLPEDDQNFALDTLARNLHDSGKSAEAERIAYTIPDLIRRSRTLCYLGKMDAAEKTLNTLVANTPFEKNEKDIALRDIGRIFLNLGNTSEAERITANLSDQDIQNDMYKEISLVFIKLKKFAEAERILDQFFAGSNILRKRDKAVAFLNLFSALIESGNRAEAERIIKKIPTRSIRSDARAMLKEKK